MVSSHRWTGGQTSKRDHDLRSKVTGFFCTMSQSTLPPRHTLIMLIYHLCFLSLDLALFRPLFSWKVRSESGICPSNESFLVPEYLHGGVWSFFRTIRHCSVPTIVTRRFLRYYDFVSCNGVRIFSFRPNLNECSLTITRRIVVDRHLF